MVCSRICGCSERPCVYSCTTHFAIRRGGTGGERGHQMERERDEAKTEMLHKVLCPG